jgi:hypothetical protein
MTYPIGQLAKMRDIARQIRELLEKLPGVQRIVIEEINKGAKAGRMGQKTLDGLHWIVLNEIDRWLPMVVYKDSDGATGWRSDLNLVLSEVDKLENKKAKDLNRRLPKKTRGVKKFPIITKKHLACRFVNEKYGAYGIQLDCEERETDGDLADAIGLGHAVLHCRFDEVKDDRGKKGKKRAVASNQAGDDL